MKKYPFLFVLLAILIAQPLVAVNIGNITAGTSTPDTEGVYSPAVGNRIEPEDLTDHVPILIDENEDFVSQGWTGSGTSGDPYIISGLNITYPSGTNSIDIRDTTVYYVIRDCFINQISTPGHGIFLHNASYGTIEHTTIVSDGGGIYVMMSNDTSISSTEISSYGTGMFELGIYVGTSWDCVIESNDIYSENLEAVVIASSENLMFSGNTIEAPINIGVIIDNCHGSLIESNTIQYCNPVGLIVGGCDDAEILSNTVSYSGIYAIEVVGSHRPTIDSNNISYTNDYAIYIENSDNGTVTNNEFYITYGGIYIWSSQNWIVSGNSLDIFSEGIIFDSGYNISAFDNDMIDGDMGIIAVDQMYLNIHDNTITEVYEGMIGDTLQEFIYSANVLESTYYGLLLFGGINGTIENNALDSAEGGMFIAGVANCEIADNSISGNPSFGVSFDSCLNLTITGNELDECGFVFGYSGPIDDYNHTLSGNLVNGRGVFYGLSLIGGTMNLADHAQIILVDCDSITIVGSTAEFVSVPVQVYYSSSIEIDGVSSTGNMRTVVGYESDDMVITDITSVGRSAEEFTSAGILLADSDNFYVENLQHSQGYYGIYITDCDYSFIESCTLDNANRGIYTSTSSANITVTNCEITDMSSYGIYGAGWYWDISNCHVFNTSYGIYVAGGQYWNIADNVLEHNSRGIQVTGSTTDNGIIDHNEIYSNSNYGIYISSGDVWNITDNTILWSGLYGIYLSGSSGTEVYYNIIGISGTNNGHDTVGQNWDDGVDTGNWWSDYSGIGTYSVGSGTDYYPMRLLPVTPLINSPMDLYYAEGTTGNEVTWALYDEYLSDYRVTINGIILEADLVPDLYEPEITIDVDGLSYGTYTVTLTVWDIEENSASDSLIVHVFDDSPPQINTPPNMEVFVGGSDQVITWEVSDLHPDTYRVLLDGEEEVTGSWTSGEIEVNVDGLTEGVHSFRIFLYDIDGNYVSDTVDVLVIDDSESPTIDTPGNVVYYVGTTGNRIIWTPSDEYPATYEVTLNNSVLTSGDWGGSRIVLDIDGLAIGTHTFALTVWDGSGHSVSDEVSVQVISYVVETTEPEPMDMTPLIIGLAVAGGVVVVIVVVYFLKIKKPSS